MTPSGMDAVCFACEESNSDRLGSVSSSHVVPLWKKENWSLTKYMYNVDTISNGSELTGRMHFLGDSV